MKTKGFTIVELLIVIVVIGILAAITIVAYNGVQQRAQNTQRVTAAKSWEKVMSLYVAQNGVYPFTFGSVQHFCLGTNNETNWDASSDQDCGWSNNIKHPSIVMNTAFAEVASLPIFPKDRVVATDGSFRGGISIRAVETLNPTSDNIANYPTLLYWLKGVNQDCVLRPVTVGVTGGIATSTDINSGIDGGTTMCRIAMPDIR